MVGRFEGKDIPITVLVATGMFDAVLSSIKPLEVMSSETLPFEDSPLVDVSEALLPWLCMFRMP
jgi:hypothetical protein